MSEAQAFTNAFDLVDVAEDGGLHAVWLAELHFNPKRSVLASPMLLAGAIGARTSRMKIGTAVQVLPLCHPLRIAEEAATVDQISDGRLIFGVGRSGFPRTYEAYGVPYEESRSASRKRWRLSNGPGPRNASRIAENISPMTRWHWCQNRGRSHIRRSALPPPASIPMPQLERKGTPSSLLPVSARYRSWCRWCAAIAR